MIKVAICDDDKDIRMKIHLVVKNYFSEIKRPLWSVEFKSGIKLLESHIRFDIIFLDIEMPVQITLKRNASSATAELLFHF